jgi:spectinomycin phosphotransferase
VRDRPAGIGERELKRALADGWHIHAETIQYAPVGGGSYHWVVRDDQDRRWFATVDDLEDKSWLGNDPVTVGAGLRAAMDTAWALRHQARLGFVAAPTPDRRGATVAPLGDKHAVTVFPFIDGTSGEFGAELPAAERTRLVEMLAALHRATPAATGARLAHVELPQRDGLETALNEIGRPWQGGPFAEPARALLSAAAGQLWQLLGTFDQLADRVKGTSELVVTHGEPHPANVLRVGADRMLIDWDTVGLARPERDLWWAISGPGEDSRRYQEATGMAVDPAALEFYRLRWTLDDASSFVSELRAEHRRTAHTEHVWRALNITLAQAAGYCPTA